MPELEQNIVYEIQQLNGKLLDIQNSIDYSMVVAWTDVNTVDQRPISITHSSATLAQTVVETFTWSGVSGNYYLTQITLS